LEVVDVQEVAEAVKDKVANGGTAVVGRVIGLKGFSTLPVDELVAIADDGTQHGNLLGDHGAQRLAPIAAQILADGGTALAEVPVEVHGSAVQELGLACGGRAEVLLQPASGIPSALWKLLTERAPAGLITRISGPDAGPDAVVVDRDGGRWGDVRGPAEATEALVEQARGQLASGRTGAQRIEDSSGVVLIEAWVPSPRLVVVGSGEVVDSLRAQAGLLGWELEATEAADQVDGLLDWAGATGALIVLSHNPHVDVPALSAGLARFTPYVGAMGSRGTQSRRATRLLGNGVSEEAIDTIHRPIGLNLGGRRAPEVALAIVAEVLACHCGRDGRPLKDTSGPIHN
jgi:xanthine dehydrogenase accessory factor